MKITRRIVVLDAADLSAESTFWARVLGGTVETEDDWHSVYVDGRPQLGIQLAPNHVPPQWPDTETEPGAQPSQRQQIHLDLYVEDVKAAHDEVLALGARSLTPGESFESTEGFHVYADPAGHPFCLCWG